MWWPETVAGDAKFEVRVKRVEDPKPWNRRRKVPAGRRRRR